MSRITRILEQKSAFEKTPTLKIKRYLYTEGLKKRGEKAIFLKGDEGLKNAFIFMSSFYVAGFSHLFLPLKAAGFDQKEPRH